MAFLTLLNESERWNPTKRQQKLTEAAIVGYMRTGHTTNQRITEKVYSVFWEKHKNIKLTGINKWTERIKTNSVESRFEVFTAMNTSIVVFWVVTPCSLVRGYQRSSETLVTRYKTCTVPRINRRIEQNDSMKDI
jgi:hypothetical protein